MNRAERRALDRALRSGDPMVPQLLLEAELLGHIGALQADGEVECPECGARLDRLELGAAARDGFPLLFECRCGWALGRLEYAP